MPLTGYGTASTTSRRFAHSRRSLRHTRHTSATSPPRLRRPTAGSRRDLGESRHPMSSPSGLAFRSTIHGADSWARHRVGGLRGGRQGTVSVSTHMSLLLLALDWVSSRTASRPSSCEQRLFTPPAVNRCSRTASCQVCVSRLAGGGAERRTRVAAEEWGNGTCFAALLLRRRFIAWRCALVCERLRCEPWTPWGWGRLPSHLGAACLPMERSVAAPPSTWTTHCSRDTYGDGSAMSNRPAWTRHGVDAQASPSLRGVSKSLGCAFQNVSERGPRTCVPQTHGGCVSLRWLCARPASAPPQHRAASRACIPRTRSGYRRGAARARRVNYCTQKEEPATAPRRCRRYSSTFRRSPVR